MRKLLPRNIAWVSWESAVNDTAAFYFAERFYKNLTNNQAVATALNSTDIQAAFDKAKNSLTQRAWVVDEICGDPESEVAQRALRDRQAEEQKPLLEAAGVPKLFLPPVPPLAESKEESAVLQEYKPTPIIPYVAAANAAPRAGSRDARRAGTRTA